jgi:hypothetical protein
MWLVAEDRRFRRRQRANASRRQIHTLRHRRIRIEPVDHRHAGAEFTL